MVRVGLLVMAASFAALGLPLIAPLGGAAKYVVAPGFIGFCFGVGCILNGWIDAMKRGE
jgi:hypothetical protein